MASVSDLIDNHPDGVFKITGCSLLEKGTFRLKIKVLVGGVPVDMSGCTTDYAQIDDGLGAGFGGKVTLGVTCGNDGVVKIEGQLTQQTETLSSNSSYPDGQPMLLTVRLKDPSTYPFYLIAPSWITVKQAPGATT